MKSFKTFMMEREQLDEGIVKKGAVAAYALQGRKHGIKAVKSYNRAKQALRAVSNTKSTDRKVDALSRSIIDILDGLVATRQQIGSVSAQVTASTVI